MKLRVNGEDRTTNTETIAALLEELHVVSERVAVEVNERVIRRAEFRTHKLHDGDVVEIVNFVGGGSHGG